MKKIFIAATHQNDGKTTVALGLIFNLKERFKKVGFIKPIGQRYLQEEGVKVDEDSVLVEKILKSCGVRCGLKDTSPIAVEKGFTENYISNPQKKAIERQISQAFRRVGKDRDIVIIEGTGHAGVGSVFDHSNARVARMLKSRVIIVSSGGIGRPIDEIALNKALFDKEGVRLAGVIINKVLPDKFDKISALVRKGLKRLGVDVLGVVPYNKILDSCTIRQIAEEVDFKLLSGQEFLNKRVNKIIVGAMQVRDAIRYFKDEMLIITPGDREDIITAVIDAESLNAKAGIKVSGIILTGGIMPNDVIMKRLCNTDIPVLFSARDTFLVASQIKDMNIKIDPQDKEKIDIVSEMAKKYLETEKIMEHV